MAVIGAGFFFLSDDCHPSSALAQPQFTVPPRRAIVDGIAKVPDAPGPGVEPNPAIIEKYLVPE